MPVEFTTQECVQSRILKTHLKESSYTNALPRLELEETKELSVDDMDVDKPEDRARNDELLLIQR